MGARSHSQMVLVAFEASAMSVTVSLDAFCPLFLQCYGLFGLSLERSFATGPLCHHPAPSGV